MPSQKKILHFLLSAWFTALSVGILGYSMSINWASTTMECAREEGGPFNGSADITFALFDGVLNRVSCPLFGGTVEFQVISTLAKKGTTSAALYGLVVCLLALCLLFSAVSILISLYNSVSNPYETYMGPIGVYTCSSLGACLSVLALIVYVVNVTVTTMSEDLVEKFSEAAEVVLRNKTVEIQLGYYLVIVYTVLSLVSISLIYMYDHMAYRHRREQERPTEDAPKEIMMY